MHAMQDLIVCITSPTWAGNERVSIHHFKRALMQPQFSPSKQVKEEILLRPPLPAQTLKPLMSCRDIFLKPHPGGITYRVIFLLLYCSSWLQEAPRDEEGWRLGEKEVSMSQVISSCFFTCSSEARGSTFQREANAIWSGCALPVSHFFLSFSGRVSNGAPSPPQIFLLLMGKENNLYSA